METLPSIEALAEYFGCTARIEAEHPEYGVLSYEVECDSEHERVGLAVLPSAEEVNVSVFTRNPSRIVRLSLQDVKTLQVAEEDEGQKVVKIDFHTSEVQTLSLRLRPMFTLLWGNYQDSPERHPPWERD